MKKNVSNVFRIARGANPGHLLLGFLCVALLAVAPAAQAQTLSGLTVKGVNKDGTQTDLTAYRWLVEEDRTYHVGFDGDNPISVPDPDNPGSAWDQNWENTLSVSFHKSYMPVVAKGCVGFEDLTDFVCDAVPFVPETGKHYFVSVLPRSGYALGGVGFKQGDTSFTAYVNQTPLPTAQISIFVFPDIAPINGAPDTPPEDPVEAGINMGGFKIIVEDGGGRYGAAAGVMSTDVYGNPLGTTYQTDKQTGEYIYVDGAPVVETMGSGIRTGPDGWAHIYNLAQGKYGIQAVPPEGSGWVQTSTIEGTKIIDAWVKPNEPPFFAEFGPPGPHVFIGFVKKDLVVSNQPGGSNITGKVVNSHMSRPPDYAFYNGACFGYTTPWVGLNDMAVGIGTGVYAAPTDAECNFTIPNVPDGNYQLVVWDSALDVIIAFKGISIVNGICNTPTGCTIGDVPVFTWFHRQEHFIFNDDNGNGIWDSNETEGGLPEFALNLRWRDGSVYQTNVSDFEGAYAFDQIFPFFSWLTAEVDFARLQATGVQVTVDNGGPIDPNDPFTYGGQLNPQDQTNPWGTDGFCEDGATQCNSDSECAGIGSGVCSVVETDKARIELGPTLVQPFQGFIGQTSAFTWGKRHYPDGENGGISGIVFYDVTRAENDPAKAGAEPWTPGIPGVRVNLYENLGVNPDTEVGSKGALLNTTTTDSWDDSIPTGCKWGNGATGPFVFSPDGVNEYPRDCYDGLRNFNQVRPGVFDGGYAFNDYCPSGMPVDTSGNPSNLDSSGSPLCSDGSTPVHLVPASYIVEVVPPAGYEIFKPEDKNVDFGDSYEIAAKSARAAAKKLAPECVGELHLLPPYLSLYPDEQAPTFLAWTTGAYQLVEMPLCDRKLAVIEAGSNAAADFFLFTEVPVAAHGIGFILDDTQNEFDPNAPNFGEKYAPPFMPVSIRDWTGREIGRTYSDQYGVYNFLAPSTSTTNVPAPSGMSPNMLTACMNDATLPDGSLDLNHNPIYSQFCYTLQYMPAVYTYLDTPVVPVGAFAGPDQFPVDCEFPAGTPRILSVDVAANGAGGNGPFIPLNGSGQVPSAQTITIKSMGTVSVPNPAYCNNAAGNCPDGASTAKFITRDYGFGSAGQVTVENFPVPLTCSSWTPTTITCSIPANTTVSGGAGGRQLTVTRTDGGFSSRTGITMQFGLRSGSKVVHVYPATNADGTSDLLASPITDAINRNSTGNNDLVMVHPGVYNEMVIMSKPVQLQGFGEGSTKINALKQPAEKLLTWRGLVESLITTGRVSLLPGQEAAFGGIEQVALMTEEGAGVLVLARDGGGPDFAANNNREARIDGFTITGADTGGGVIVNGYGRYLEISNNRIANNSGVYGGGIRVGHPQLTNLAQDAYEDGQNDWVDIHNNQVSQNGALDGAGAGISMCTGSDFYKVTTNWVCGNFNTSEGGGIGHIGRSDGRWTRAGGSTPWVLQDVPLIEGNTVIFNETFLQGRTVSGGGLFIGGEPSLTLNGLSPGAGNVRVNRNLIQGNAAGAGDGGGIRLARINGQDVAANPNNTPKRNSNQGGNDPSQWNTVSLFNNIIVNNVAGLAGGGISLQDAADVRILHNTIANNDSLGTAGEAFAPGNPNRSNAQPGAGIVTRLNSTQLDAVIPGPATFSNPRLEDTIVWHNRKFFFQVGDGIPGDPGSAGIWGLCPDIGGSITGLVCPGGNGPVYDDLAVIGIAGALTCDSASCIDSGGADPLFLNEVVNGDRTSVIQAAPTTPIQAPPAFDEGGNFIQPRFGPLTLIEAAAPRTLYDYHIKSNSPAVNNGVNVNAASPLLATDFDKQPRPAAGTQVDIGADEVPPAKSTEQLQTRTGATGRLASGN